MNLFLESPGQAAGRARRTAVGRAGVGCGSTLFDGPDRALDPVPEPASGPIPAPAPRAQAVPRAAEAACGSAYESYEAEIAFSRKRERRRALGRILRVLALAFALPVLMAVAFFASYTVTLILRGFTPEQVVDQLQVLASQIEGGVRAILPMI